ncbi:MAG: hypothetical protein QOE62_3325 [Actinomycetota bacterium]|nr:hypothetical protein [Actinomycetota bacterium]
MNERDRLETDLRRVLHERAGGVVVEDRVFEPASRTVVTETRVMRRVSRIRGRVLVVVVLVAALAVTAVIARTASSPGRSVHVIEPPPTIPALAPGQVVQVDSPVVAPRWVPVNEQLWSFDTQRTTSSVGGISQLVGLPAREGNLQAAIYIAFQPAPPESSPPSGASSTTLPAALQDHRPRITLRGVRAIVEPAKDAPGTMVTIDWIERRTYVSATVRGLSIAQAQALLNRLRQVGTALLRSGYAANSVPAPYVMIAQRAPTPAGPETNATFGYWAHAPSGAGVPDIYVTTSRHELYPGYLRAAIGGRFDPDGSAIEYDPSFNVVTRVTLNAGSVRVVGRSGVPRATLERVARSIDLVDATRETDLRAQVDSRIRHLPSIGSAHVPLGAVTLRGAGRAVAVCLQPRDARVVCSSVPAGDGTGWVDYSRLSGGVLTPSGWIIFAASPGSPSRRIIFGNQPAQHATIGDRDILVALVSQPIPEIQLWLAQNPPGATGPGIVGAVQRPRRD